MPALRTAGTLLCSLVLGAAFLVSPSLAEQVTKEGDKGDVTVTTTIKRDGESCETGATDTCDVGKPCFTNIEITGEPARQLYLTLKERGVKIMDCCGEYVGTESDSIICWGGSHHFRCTIGYSSARNEISRPVSCQHE